MGFVDWVDDCGTGPIGWLITKRCCVRGILAALFERSSSGRDEDVIPMILYEESQSENAYVVGISKSDFPIPLTPFFFCPSHSKHSENIWNLQHQTSSDHGHVHSLADSHIHDMAGPPPSATTTYPNRIASITENVSIATNQLPMRTSPCTKRSNEATRWIWNHLMWGLNAFRISALIPPTHEIVERGWIWAYFGCKSYRWWEGTIP